MCKVYARQVNPEYQDSYLLFWNSKERKNYWEDDVWQDITLTGNKDFHGIETDVFSRVYQALANGDLQEAIDEVDGNGYYVSHYDTYTEAIMDVLPPENKAKYSTMDIHKLKLYSAEYQACKTREENDVICKVLSIVDGREYAWRTLRGCCQGDWIECFYPSADYDKTSLETLESLYFNTGSEWIFDDECQYNPETDEPGDICGCSVYCTSWNDDGIRREIADAAGCKPEEVTMYQFDGYTQIERYKAV